ncbi:MAG: MerR family transcriptional regulator [Pseudomonadota bacterium]
MSYSAARKIEKTEDAYRSIGEAAQELGLQPHVLRYWEGKFGKFVKPLKRRDGRRMFRPDDMQALRAIQILVHQRGLTLKGASKLLTEQGIDNVLTGRAMLAPVGEAPVSASQLAQSSPARSLQDSVRRAFEPNTLDQTDVPQGTTARLESVLDDLNDIKSRLDAARGRRAF